MAYCNTILNQITAFFPRHEFEKMATTHHTGQKFRYFSRWSQFLAMTIAQFPGRKSLRDLTTNIKAQGLRIYHLGMKQASRATLARVNEQQPYQIYKRLFFQLSMKCKKHAPRHRFSFKGKIYLLDATAIDLCLKRNADVEHLGKWRNSKIDNVESDKRIRLKGMTTNHRLVTYRDPETEKVYHFLTNSFRVDAANHS